eukprot:scaffold38190_cov260-Amphora_coffeaeformis.AAC.1
MGKVEIHVPIHGPTNEDREGDHKETNLRTRSDGNPHGQVHFVFACHGNGRHVFDGIPHNGQQNDTDKGS